MCPTIRIDDEVYSWLQGQARPFDDTPNSVLRRIAKLNASQDNRLPSGQAGRESIEHGEKTPQSAYRQPILRVLAKLGGQAARVSVLKELEKIMAKQLTPHDKGKISSGTIRWEKSAEWEVRKMRQETLLKPVDEAPRGYWALSKRGEKITGDS